MVVVILLLRFLKVGLILIFECKWEWLFEFFEIELGEIKKLTESDKKKKRLDLRKCYCEHKNVS